MQWTHINSRGVAEQIGTPAEQGRAAWAGAAGGSVGSGGGACPAVRRGRGGARRRWLADAQEEASGVRLKRVAAGQGQQEAVQEDAQQAQQDTAVHGQLVVVRGADARQQLRVLAAYASGAISTW